MAGRIAYYGNIVTNGLVLDLDAGKKDSYPGSGTTWRDLSGNNNSGSLVNGPTYNSLNGGSIVFDGVNDYVNSTSLLNLTSSISVFAFIRPSQKTGTTYPQILNKWDEINNKRCWILDIESQNNRFGIAISNNGAFTPSNTKYYYLNTSVVYNTWQQIGFTFSSGNLNVYLNGIDQPVIKNQDPAITSIFSADNPIQMGAYNSTSDGYFSGSISIAQIYNRALSAQEVQQNYNALKSRYGL